MDSKSIISSGLDRVTGAADILGQIGSELTIALRDKYGVENVIGLVHKTPPSLDLAKGPIEKLDITDREGLETIIKKYAINIIYHLASLLSAVGERNPDVTWHVNMTGLKNILDLGVKYKIKRVFWPSSIAAFGPSAIKDSTPQDEMLDPTTMYGVTKVAGELLCNYYFSKYALDVRGLRYPGLISYKTPPGGGTTDYAIAIFYEGLEKKKYECFDAIRATIELMEVDASSLTIRKHIPSFECTFVPDERNKIAASWPRIIDDSVARKDWGWNQRFDLPKMVSEMIKHLKQNK